MDSSGTKEKHLSQLAEIEIISRGAEFPVSKVFVDGQDFSDKICGVSYTHNDGDFPRVTLTFIPKTLRIRALGNALARNVSLLPDGSQYVGGLNGDRLDVL